MSAPIVSATPVLPSADVAASLAWWTGVCGFTENFRFGTPPSYAGVQSGGTVVHLSLVSGAALARLVGEQTTVRLQTTDLEGLHSAFLARGGILHPNGALELKPWGSREFATIDPNGVCVTFQQV